MLVKADVLFVFGGIVFNLGISRWRRAARRPAWFTYPNCSAKPPQAVRLTKAFHQQFQTLPILLIKPI